MVVVVIRDGAGALVGRRLNVEGAAALHAAQAT